MTWLQVDLEPSGKLHCKIELQWATQEEQAQPLRQFKEGEGFAAVTRRRGAMKRRVHQVYKTTRKSNPFDGFLNWLTPVCQLRVPASPKHFTPEEYSKAWWHDFCLVKRPGKYFAYKWSEKKVPIIAVIGLYDTYQKCIKIGGLNSYQFGEKWTWVF